MWLDDEGLNVAEPVVNEVATRIAPFYGFTWQPYVGPVVFRGSIERSHSCDLSTRSGYRALRTQTENRRRARDDRALDS
jgi:hypothetical protein